MTHKANTQKKRGHLSNSKSFNSITQDVDTLIMIHYNDQNKKDINKSKEEANHSTIQQQNQNRPLYVIPQEMIYI